MDSLNAFTGVVRRCVDDYGMIAPGDRILSLDGHPWDGDVCRFLLDPDPLDGTVCGIGTASGQHVVLTIETMK